MTDEQIVIAAQQGDRDAADTLVRSYRNLAFVIAGDYFLEYGDRDDREQEALIGILRGIHAWRPERGVRFRFFVQIAIRRQLSDAAKLARRKKHRFVSKAIRGDLIGLDGEIDDVLHIVPDASPSVPDQVIAREHLRIVATRIQTRLSPLEASTVVALLNDVPYADIGPVKVVDNALQRARLKLRAAA